MVGKNNNEPARIRNKELSSRRADMWVKEANGKLNELSRLLLTLVALIFTLSLPIISNPTNLDDISKVFLVLSWFSSLISLAFGIYNIWLDAKYFERLKNVENKSEGIWSETDGDYNEMFDKDQENRTGIPMSTSFIPLTLQLVFLIISLLLLTAIGIRLITTTHFSKQPSLDSKTRYGQMKNYPQKSSGCFEGIYFKK